MQRVPRRCGWSGTAARDDGAPRAGRAVPAARLAARRGPLGDDPEDDDAWTRKPPTLGGLHRRARALTQKRVRQRHLPGRSRGEGLHHAASRAFRDEVHGPAHRPRQAARGRRASSSRPARTARRGTGWTTASRSPPAPTSSRPEVRDTAGNVGIDAGRDRGRARSPGRPGLTVRGLAAQPPLRPVTAGQRVEFFVDARGAPYRWRVRRVGDSAVRKRGAATEPEPRASARPTGPSGVYLLELRSGRWHTTVPFLVQAEKRSSVLVVVPAITLARHRQGRRRRSTASRTRSTDGGDRALAARVRRHRRAAGRLRRRRRAAARLPRPPARSATTSRATSTSTSRATRAPAIATACCSPGSERWVTRTLAQPPAPLRDSTAAASPRSAPTRCAAACALRVRAGRRRRDAARAPTQPTTTDPFGARLGQAAHAAAAGRR